MRAQALRRLGDLPSDAVVLDVGGWAAPVARADWVIDLCDYATRGLYGAAAPDQERFSADTWVRADVCGPDPWPFGENQFDVALCSHTLEDVRDPVFVCRELSRVARAGYVEVPAPIDDLTHGVQGDWIGWSHHRWISEAETTSDSRRGLVLTHKPHLLCAPGRHLPAGSHRRVAEADRVLAWWWEGELPARERVHVAAEGFDAWLAGLLERCAAQAGVPAPRIPAPASGTGRSRGGRLGAALARRARRAGGSARR